MTNLTPREQEIKKYIEQQKDEKEIAKIMHVSRHTIKSLVSAILKKSILNND